MSRYPVLITILSTTFILFLSGCTQPKEDIRITGKVNLHGSETWSIEAQPVHYKYGDATTYSLDLNSDNRFRAQLKPNKEFRPEPPLKPYLFYRLKTGDRSYPLYLRKGKSYEFYIDRVEFPKSIRIEGYPQSRIRMYRKYLGLRDSLQGRMEKHNEAFQNGDTRRTLQLQRELMKQTKEIFGQSPLRRLYYYELGKLVEKKLQALRYTQVWEKGYEEAEKARSQILEFADERDFFTYESQLAQRAGIRDVANAYSMTFGIQEDIRREYGQNLLIYDVKRLGYAKMDSAKRSLLQYVDSEKARAYARLYLITERIGDYSVAKGEADYSEYMNEYGSFPRFQKFLEQLYEQRKEVSPGKPAVDFSLPDSTGTNHTLTDFKGKLTLLDFWASWCVPCMEEMDDIQRIYNNYSRNDFEVVSISIEKDSSAWLHTIKQKQPPWVQLYAGKGFDHPLFESYMGGGIPFYILIGRDGQILRYNDVHASFNLDSVLQKHIKKSD